MIATRVAIAYDLAKTVGGTTCADSGSVTLPEPHTWYQAVVNIIGTMPDQLLYSVALTLACLGFISICRRLLDWYLRPARTEWLLVIMPDIMYEPEAEPGTVDEPTADVPPPLDDIEDDEVDQDEEITAEQIAFLVARVRFRRAFLDFMIGLMQRLHAPLPAIADVRF